MEKNYIKLSWLSYGINEERILKNSNYELFHINEFKTSKELIEKIDPKLIYLIPGMSIIENAFWITANILKIPTFQWAVGIPFFTPNKNKKKLLREMIRQSTEKVENGNKSQRKGNKFIKNNLFFIKSMKKLKIKYREILKILLNELKTYFYLQIQEKSCTINLVENQMSSEFLENKGLSKEKNLVTGDPTYDLAFEKLKTMHSIKDSKKFEILFLTVNYSSGQGDTTWTPFRRDKMIRELRKEVENNNFSLKIKIHPTNEKIKDYQKILNDNSNIEIIQNEDIYELIEKSDVILTTSANTAASIALILKKPIVIWNYFDVKGDLFLKNKIALECKNSSEINNCLNNAKKFSISNDVHIKNFIKKFLGNGDALTKIANGIEQIIKK